MTPVERVYSQALALSPEERVALANLLLDASEEPDEAWWAEVEPEMERRIRAVESGEAKTTPWPEVRKSLFERVNSPRD